MKKPLYIAHVNCSPWVEDGMWNIVTDGRYHSFAGEDSDTTYTMLEKILESALDNDVIDSYYIQRPEHPAPVKHSN